MNRFNFHVHFRIDLILFYFISTIVFRFTVTNLMKFRTKLKFRTIRTVYRKIFNKFFSRVKYLRIKHIRMIHTFITVL